MPLSHLRSLLFIPATATRFLSKALERGADAVILDLEDSVPADGKAAAREQLGPALDILAGRLPVLVRVNSEPRWLADDVAALPLTRLQGVMLPKAESAHQVRDLGQTIAARLAQGEAAPALVPLIETPLGVLRLEAIATAHLGVAALGFGAEDYATAMRTEPRPATMQWAAQGVTNCARAFGLACWGLPGSVAELDDMAAFTDLVQRARAVGFSGTVCIHPRQVPVANMGFGPSAQELDWARQVIAAAEAAQAHGLGVATLDGRMIDRPILERARRLHPRS